MSSRPSARSCSSPSLVASWSPSCCRSSSPAPSPSRSAGLSAAAEHVRRGINKRVEIPDFTQRRDEIGHLSGALRDMTTALYNRIDAIEAFAADVSHELKNPLTSLQKRGRDAALRQDRGAARPPGRDRQGRRAPARPSHHRHLRMPRGSMPSSPAAATSRSTCASCSGRVVIARQRDAQARNRRTSSSKMQPPPRIIDARQRLRRPRPRPPPGPGGAQSDRQCALLHPARDPTSGSGCGALPGDVEFRVEDEGPGIRPDNLERIFERFYTDRPEGYFGKNSGLGLSISKQIVEAHHGRIWAENRYGKAPAGERAADPRRDASSSASRPSRDDWEPDDEA